MVPLSVADETEANMPANGRGDDVRAARDFSVLRCVDFYLQLYMSRSWTFVRLYRARSPAGFSAYTPEERRWPLQQIQPGAILVPEREYC